MLNELNSLRADPKYYLLNKDELIASFHVDSLTDGIVIDEEFVKLPFWYTNLADFITNRRAPKNRENIAFY